METIALETGLDGIAIATLDVPGRSVNTLTHQVRDDLAAMTAKVASDAAIRAVVLRSGKPTGFCVGADLGELRDSMANWRAAKDEAALATAIAQADRYTAVLRSIETCGKPFVAAIEGTTLGGGLEIALACHARVAVDDPALKLGLPEAKLDLMPGAGGTQRLPRLIGLVEALPFLLEGRDIPLDAARDRRMIDAIAPAGSVIERARSLASEMDAVARWDVKGYDPKPRGPHCADGYRHFPSAIAAAVRDGAHERPARGNILRAVYEGSVLPIDAALRVELRYFFLTATTAQAESGVAAFLDRSGATKAPVSA